MFGVTLDDLKQFLGYDVAGSPSPVDARDPALTLLLSSGFATLQKLTGRNLVYGRYRDTFNYYPDRAYLRESPAASIVSVQIAGAEVSASEYQAFLKSGLVNFTNRRCCTGNDTSLLTIEYIGGYQTLPDDMLLAVFASIQQVDTVQKQLVTSGGILKRVSVYDVGVTDYYIPPTGSTNSVMQSTMLPMLGLNAPNTAEELGGWRIHESELLEAL